MLYFDIQIKLRFLGNIVRIKRIKRKNIFEDKLFDSAVQQNQKSEDKSAVLRKKKKKKKKRQHTLNHPPVSTKHPEQISAVPKPAFMS